MVTWTNLTPRSCFVVSIAPRKQPGQEIVEDNDNWFSWHKLSDRRSGSKTLGSGRIRNRGSGEQRNMGRGLRRSFWWTHRNEAEIPRRSSTPGSDPHQVCPKLPFDWRWQNSSESGRPHPEAFQVAHRRWSWRDALLTAGTAIASRIRAERKRPTDGVLQWRFQQSRHFLRM